MLITKLCNRQKEHKLSNIAAKNFFDVIGYETPYISFSLCHCHMPCRQMVPVNKFFPRICLLKPFCLSQFVIGSFKNLCYLDNKKMYTHVRRFFFVHRSSLDLVHLCHFLIRRDLPLSFYFGVDLNMNAPIPKYSIQYSLCAMNVESKKHSTFECQ